MKINTSILNIVLITFMIGCTSNSNVRTPEKWTKHQVSEWFGQKEWLGQTKMQSNPSFDQKEFAIQYYKNKARWDKAFAFMKETNVDSLKPGTYPIDGKNVFVKVTEYNSKNAEDVSFEAHKNYSDIHYVVLGTEYIGRAVLSKARVMTPYDDEKDIVFYEAKESQILLAEPGTFFIVFPNELHRSGVKVEESIPVKKIVIKIMN